jgi:hypothetical protein
MQLSEAKKKKRGSTVIRKTFPEWYPWYTLGLGGLSASGEQPEAPAGGEGGVSESFDDHFDQVDNTEKAEQEYAGKLKELPTDQQKEISAYTLESKTLNTALGKRKDAIQQGHVTAYGANPDESRAQVLSQALNSAGALSEPLTVYHGTSEYLHPEIAKQYSAGIVHIPTFTSTSTRSEMAARYAADKNGERHVIQLKIPAGFQGGAFIRSLSDKPDENEFLIDHNQMMRIGDKLGEIENHKGDKVHVWHGELVSPEQAAETAGDNPFAAHEIGSHKNFKTKSFQEMLEEKLIKRKNMP